MPEKSTTEFGAAMNAGIALAQATGAKGDGAYALEPAGTVIFDLEKFLPAPRRIVQTVTFENVASFVAYANRFKQDSSVVFSAPKQGAFTAILDYHKAPDAPAWGSHIAKLKLQPTEEWAAWRESNRKEMDQAEFAEFIEERYREIADPPAATMLEVALTFEAKKDVEFRSGMRLENGQVSFVYNEEIGATTRAGTVEVPTKFKLFFPVFEGQGQEFVEARFRYRLRDAKLALWYDLIRPDKLIASAVDDVALQIKNETQLEPLAGSIPAAGGQR
jgi:uncharacterized protein YfdQ (DUF2303 family)